MDIKFGTSLKYLMRSIITLACTVSFIGQANAKSSSPKKVILCMSQNGSSDDYVLEIKCGNLATAKVYHATWFVGFEQSILKLGYSAIPATIGNQRDYDQVLVPSDIRKVYEVKGARRPVAYQITFVGRYTLENGASPRTIIIDKLLSIRRVRRGRD